MTASPIVRVATLLLVWLAAVFAVTELTGWLFAWPAAFGGLRIGSFALYWPGQFLGWRGLLAPGHRWIVDGAAVASGLCALALAARVVLDLRRTRRPGFGAGRWADRAAVRRSGLL